MNTSGDVPTSQKYPGWSPEALGDVPASQLKDPDLILTHSWRCHSVSYTSPCFVARNMSVDVRTSR